MPKLMMPIILVLAVSSSFFTIAFAQESTITLPSELSIFSDPFDQVTAQLYKFVAERGILIIGALAYLALFYVIGKVAGGITKRVITKWLEGPIAKRIKETVEKSGEKFESYDDDSDTLGNPVNLIPKTVSWFFYVIGIVAAVNTLGLPEFAGAVSAIGLWIPKLIAAIVIIVLGSVLVKFALAWIVGREWFGKESQDYKTMSTALKVIVYSMVIAIALTTIDVGQDVIPILVQAFAYALAGAFVIAVGWGMRDFVPNWWMGREVRGMGVVEGNEIETKSDSGIIDRIGRTQFRIKTKTNKFIIVPYKDLLDVHFALVEKKYSGDHPHPDKETNTW